MLKVKNTCKLMYIQLKYVLPVSFKQLSKNNLKAQIEYKF